MKSVIDPSYSEKKDKLDQIIETFDSSEDQILKAERNTLKLFELDNSLVNVKSFKVPNIFNQIIYKYFRKSKARRSFEFAKRLIQLGVGTPKPIAYYEYNKGLLFGRSYYISSHLDYDLTYRELITNTNYPDYDNILRAFTRFTYALHEKGIEFLDHSPGNTLIIKKDAVYNFYLVDLNRMKFGELDFDARMKNFARLTKNKAMVKIMSDEYASCISKNPSRVFDAMWAYVLKFRASVEKKKKVKNILGRT
jgi:hypothetical protein